MSNLIICFILRVVGHERSPPRSVQVLGLDSELLVAGVRSKCELKYDRFESFYQL